MDRGDRELAYQSELTLGRVLSALLWGVAAAAFYITAADSYSPADAVVPIVFAGLCLVGIGLSLLRPNLAMVLRRAMFFALLLWLILGRALF